MTDTVPVKFAADISTGLDDRWRELGRTGGGNPHWPPLAIKITYVFGVIHDICESVDWLLKASNAWPVTYLSAIGVCASGMELLGRCLEGDAAPSGHSTQNLRRGLTYLLESWRTGKLAQSGILANTLMRSYSIEDFIALRHFSAHGQATAAGLGIIDNELLEKLPPLIANAMERYWNDLQQDVPLCERMARANILPLMLRHAPLLKMWTAFQEEGKSIQMTFKQFTWKVSGGA